MLVLTRKRDESIMIGDDIKVTVVDVRGDQVKLGIEAPRHIPVHREEVYREIQEENRRAALKASQDLSVLEQVLRRSGVASAETTKAGAHVPGEAAQMHGADEEATAGESPAEQDESAKVSRDDQT